MARPLTKTHEFKLKLTEAQHDRLVAWAAGAGMSKTDFLIYASHLDVETTSGFYIEWPEEVAARLGIPVVFDTDDVPSPPDRRVRQQT